MSASKLRPGLTVGGKRITRTVPGIRNGQRTIRAYFADGTDTLFSAGASVPVGGYREPLPAGDVIGASVARETRKVRASDGRWRGQEGGFRIDLIARTTMYDK